MIAEAPMNTRYSVHVVGFSRVDEELGVNGMKAQRQEIRNAAFLRFLVFGWLLRKRGKGKTRTKRTLMYGPFKSTRILSCQVRVSFFDK